MRIYRRKSTRAKFDEDVVRRAVLAHVAEKRSLQSVSSEFNIPKRTLARYCQRYREAGLNPNVATLSVGYRRSRQVFSREEEKFFCEYLRVAGEMGHILTPSEIRRLAYNYASANRMLTPSTWVENSMAGEEWYANFKRRNRLQPSLQLVVEEDEDDSTTEEGSGSALDEMDIPPSFGTHWLADLLPGVSEPTSFQNNPNNKLPSPEYRESYGGGTAPRTPAAADDGESREVQVKAHKSRRKSVTPMKRPRISWEQQQDGSTSDE